MEVGKWNYDRLWQENVKQVEKIFWNIYEKAVIFSDLLNHKNSFDYVEYDERYNDTLKEIGYLWEFKELEHLFDIE